MSRSPGRDYWNVSGLQPWQGVSFQLFPSNNWPRPAEHRKEWKGSGRRNRVLDTGFRTGRELPLYNNSELARAWSGIKMYSRKNPLLTQNAVSVQKGVDERCEVCLVVSIHGLGRPVSKVRDYYSAGYGELGRRITEDGGGQKGRLVICRVSVMLKGIREAFRDQRRFSSYTGGGSVSATINPRGWKREMIGLKQPQLGFDHSYEGHTSTV